MGVRERGLIVQERESLAALPQVQGGIGMRLLLRCARLPEHVSFGMQGRVSCCVCVRNSLKNKCAELFFCSVLCLLCRT